MAEVFVLPDFLEDADADKIQARMMKELPEDIDDMPGGFPWDFTMPTALVISEFVQDRFVRVLQLMFPQFAWGTWLDLHGERVHVTRRAARKATGTITVTGNTGVLIPAGTIFCTPATDNSDSVLFATDTEVMVMGENTEIPVTAVEAGTGSNVRAGAVSIAFRPITGLTSITNVEAITGGTDEEDDETYRGRIIEAYRSSSNFTGCPADYVRWAKEVSGVGFALCIPEWDGPGTVKLVITDSNGDPGSQAILDEVYEHIMADSEDSLLRLAPIGATLTVVAPEPVEVTYTCYVKVDDDYTMNQIREACRTNLEAYYAEAIEDGELKYADCFAIITQTDGVYDAKNFRLNGGTDNIPISQGEFPLTVALNLTAY